ncbi:hypothetical protein HDU76_005692 [Blyttiomyces sp. JEL0837]|nr:hypothetical protein HDU76_005692 [Blyttiomyces sp. JEL0837]
MVAVLPVTVDDASLPLTPKIDINNTILKVLPDIFGRAHVDLNHPLWGEQSKMTSTSIVNYDEMRTDGAIRIQDHIAEMLRLPKDQPTEVATIGDLGTIVTMRSAIHERSCEKFGGIVGKLSHLVPVFGEFHYQWAVLRAVVSAFGWHPYVEGTIGAFGHLRNRSMGADPLRFDFFELEGILMDVFKAYILLLVDYINGGITFEPGSDSASPTLSQQASTLAGQIATCISQSQYQRRPIDFALFSGRNKSKPNTTHPSQTFVKTT